MSATPELSRRQFLKTGVLATTGVVIAFHIPGAIGSRAQAAASSLEPNAWLTVDGEGNVRVMIARSEMGQGVRTSLPMLVAEELEADWTKVRFEQAIPADKYGSMATGGSQSIRSMWEPLRTAGAQAREMLIEAAARTWQVDPSACRAENGTVVHEPSGRRLAYGALAAKAATLRVPGKPRLKDRSEFKIIGHRTPQLDMAEKVDGRAVFGLDVRMPGLLTAVVERGAEFGSRLRSYGPADARAVKGVRRVVQISSGVAIVADSYWAANKARQFLEMEWDEGAMHGVHSITIARAFADQGGKPGTVVRKQGDGAAALAGAARKLEAVYQTPYLAHATMEPVNCTAHVKKDSCEIWVGSQNATDVQAKAAELTGLPKSKVTVHLPSIGGGFGRRHELDVVIEAVELSKAMDAPVKVVMSREDDIQHDWYRPANYHVLRAGLDASGQPLAWTHHLVGPAILKRLAPGAIRNGVDPSSLDGAANLPYGFPHIEVDYLLSDPGIPVGWWRSVSASQNVFAVECFLDEVASAAGRDPLEFRRGLLTDHPRHRAVLDLAAEKAGWGTPLPSGSGRGLAVAESFGSFVAQVAEVSVDDDGQLQVTRVVCAVDCGGVVNPDSVEAQLESGIVFGLSAALFGEITFDHGKAVQNNFNDYRIVGMGECPAIEVFLAPSGDPVGGIGEVAVPPIAPAVVNAVAAASGKRIRSLPIKPAELKRG